MCHVKGRTMFAFLINCLIQEGSCCMNATQCITVYNGNWDSTHSLC